MSETERARLREVAETASPRGSSYEAWIDPPTVLALIDALASQGARLAAVEARTEAAFAGIRCALLHWQPEGATKAVSCVNCESWAANIAMPFFRAALHSDPSEATT